tara:strand:- start:12191 stop:12772 length:582 start_codon:yes stop_codon:yes gene_type:complete
VSKNYEFLSECTREFDKDEIEEVVDWGPGGGWLSKFFVDCDIHLVDIVSSNLEESAENVRATARSVEAHHIKDIEEANTLGSLSPDILMAFSVIYHFPTIEYWKSVSGLWNQMSPRYIVGRTFLTNGDSWQRSEKKYAVGRNYLRGIVLNKEEFINSFPDYKIIYEKKISQKYDRHGAPADQYSYVFLFERKA